MPSGRASREINRLSDARSLIIITNPEQASFRLRIEAVITLLRPRGFAFEIVVRPRQLLPRRRLLRSAGDYHAVILQRKLLDPSDARLLRRHARRILYDIDDAVMFHAHRVGRLAQWRTTRRFEATARILDHVVAGNAYLAQMFHQRGKEVTILPTTVDPADYPLKRHASNDAPRLVWIGSSSTLPYLRALLPAMQECARRVRGLGLITIADQTLEDGGPLQIEHIPWSLQTQAASLLRGDIGIAPTPRDRWTLGKCGFKIIQYMAAGLPVIASPVGANAEIVKPGETGLLADDSAQWVDAIVRLCEGADLRSALGAAGRRRVEACYSLAHAADVWEELLDDQRPAAGSANA
jgi:glycosyltransferase involved in cell wall biosynthesis